MKNSAIGGVQDSDAGIMGILASWMFQRTHAEDVVCYHDTGSRHGLRIVRDVDFKDCRISSLDLASPSVKRSYEQIHVPREQNPGHAEA